MGARTTVAALMALMHTIGAIMMSMTMATAMNMTTVYPVAGNTLAIHRLTYMYTQIITGEFLVEDISPFLLV